MPAAGVTLVTCWGKSIYGAGDIDCVEALVVRLPDEFLCYRPEADASEVAPLVRAG